MIAISHQSTAVSAWEQACSINALSVHAPELLIFSKHLAFTSICKQVTHTRLTLTAFTASNNTFHSKRSTNTQLWMNSSTLHFKSKFPDFCCCCCCYSFLTRHCSNNGTSNCSHLWGVCRQFFFFFLLENMRPLSVKWDWGKYCLPNRVGRCEVPTLV